MTKFGISVTIAVLILIAGVGFFIFGRPDSTTYQNPKNIETPVTQTPTPPTTPEPEFDKSVSLALEEKVIFTDGLSIQLKEINDSRCKLDVQCFWQGELSVLFGMTSTNPEILSSEFRLGTVSKESITLKGYKFTLESATEKSADIIVSKVK